MKAVVYEGPNQVSVKDVPDARVERPTDVLVRVTTTAICGSDLHMFEGRTDFERGRVFGHESLGEVVEVGSAVDRVQVGDMVCLPFNVACGFCANCERGLTAFCQTTNPDPRIDGAAYGFADMGPYQGGQADLLRVPYGDFNCLVLPEDAHDPARQRDYVMLADIFPTGWHVTNLACVEPGDSVAIYGAGPVGQMAALSCAIRNAGKIMIVDYHEDRLKLAEEAGAIPINAANGSPAEQIKELTDGRGADRGCECVGYQAVDPQGNEHPNITLNNLVDSVRFAGTIGVVGMYVSQGEIPFDYGLFWFKGQTMGTGQCNVKSYNRVLLGLIQAELAKPSYIVSHELTLDQAPDGYEHFDRRDPGWTKVVMHPDGR